jgi:hypothetical protein
LSSRQDSLSPAATRAAPRGALSQTFGVQRQAPPTALRLTKRAWRSWRRPGHRAAHFAAAQQSQQACLPRGQVSPSIWVCCLRQLGIEPTSLAPLPLTGKIGREKRYEGMHSLPGSPGPWCRSSVLQALLQCQMPGCLPRRSLCASQRAITVARPPQMIPCE